MRAIPPLVVIVFAASTSHYAAAQSSKLVKPTSRKDVHREIVLPTAAICDTMVAFDVKLAENPSASPVTIVRTNLEWAGTATVTEFEPVQPFPPFSRFFFLETAQSHKVEWAMGAAFFDSHRLALEAGAEYAEYYSNALQAPVREGLGDMYSVYKDDLHLMLLIDEKTVRVSCEHRPTANLGLQEALKSAANEARRLEQ